MIHPPVTGRFRNGEPLAYSDDTHDGKTVRVRYRWSRITANSAHWDQAFSVDNEQT